uniref:Integrase, catalytic region, zinc finger, CCHC-type, peptidase aspartic, catalytic n=1 Tax=Tanacetum cinerariifolium TaxID=118510 RepID=A0A699GPY3_TANCI|nr:integrase, catalytic region, zinc finger, CCHC-type, peptidase aspartic, catalytic [Tanacetum cinerariifolium]
MDLMKAGENRFLQINELDEMRLDAYESSISYTKRTKRWHDKRIKIPINYEKGDKVSKDMKNRALELHDEDGSEFIVNKQWVKPYQNSLLDTNMENDREDIGKLGAKGDIGFFIGYSANSVAYRVYNPRTKKIMETMNVTFDELSAMDFEQNSSRPEAPRIITAALVLQNLQASTAFMSIQDSASVPKNSSNTLVSSHNVGVPSKQHAQFIINPFATPSTESVVSSTQYVDPSKMHTFYLPYPHDYQWTKGHPLEQVIGEPSRPVLTRSQLKTDGDMCIYELTVNIMELKSVKEALTNPDWIESMQEEIHQFIKLDRSNEDIRLEMAKLIKNNRILLNDNILPHEEASMEVLLPKEKILKLIQAWDDKQIESWSLPELLLQLLNDSRTIDEMLKQREQTAILTVQQEQEEQTAQIFIPNWNFSMINDDEEHSIQYKEYLEKFSNALTTVLLTKEPEYSLSMGYKYLSTISETKSNYVIKSSVKNLVPIPSEYEVVRNHHSCCQVFISAGFLFLLLEYFVPAVSSSLLLLASITAVKQIVIVS